MSCAYRFLCYFRVCVLIGLQLVGCCTACCCFVVNRSAFAYRRRHLGCAFASISPCFVLCCVCFSPVCLLSCCVGVCFVRLSCKCVDHRRSWKSIGRSSTRLPNHTANDPTNKMSSTTLCNTQSTYADYSDVLNNIDPWFYGMFGAVAGLFLSIIGAGW